MCNAPVRKRACSVSRKLSFLVFHKLQCNHIAISSACIGKSSYKHCMESGKILLKLQLCCSLQGHWDRFFFKYINFLLTVSFHQHSIFNHLFIHSFVTIAVQSHTTAVQSHTIAVQSHTTAVQSHTVAVQSHTTAVQSQ